MKPASRWRIMPIALAQAVGLLCGVAGIQLTSRHISPADLGVYGIFLTLASIGVWIVHAGLIKFVNRNWLTAENRSQLWREITARWVRRLPLLALAAAVASGAVVLIAQVNLAVFALLVFAAAALLSITALAQTALQAARQHWWDFSLSATASVGRTFLPIALYVATTGAATTLFVGFSLHALVAAGFGLAAVRANRQPFGGPGARPGEIAAIYEGGLFTALALAGWLLSGINRWVVAGFYGEHEAGYFTLMGGAAAIIPSMLGTMFLQYFQPGLYAAGDSGGEGRAKLARRVDKIAAGYCASAVLAAVVLAQLGPWLTTWLIAATYRPALPWLLPAGCFAVAVSTALIYYTLVLAGRRERGCGPVELATSAVLAIGCIATAAAGLEWFARWLTVTPIVPWLITRPIARHYFFTPDSAPAPAPAR